MGYTRTKAVLAGAFLVALGACGDDSSSSKKVEVTVDEKAAFPAGSTMAELNDAGKITIGVKIDQPGIGFQKPGADAPEGFDIEMGRIIAAKLGIADSDITWTETISDNREPFIEAGKVDIVIASYSITDERRAIVGQAGPYYVTGQQLLVREEDKGKIAGPEDLKGVKVCSVEGSTSLATAQDKYGADPTPQGTYSECVNALKNGTTDVVTTDGAILLGYAAEAPDDLEVVGDAFSEERYGVGYKLGDTEFCQFITDTITAAEEDGTWAKAFENTLGQSGVDTPEPPKMDPCE
ncbi:MAG: glutamate ABC transporter substrate-binding protein [Propionibacteriales bacterium]|nr:glutamate ABC transporter substrate-binding protein [Propionibacteriales bacterium]